MRSRRSQAGPAATGSCSSPPSSGAARAPHCVERGREGGGSQLGRRKLVGLGYLGPARSAVCHSDSLNPRAWVSRKWEIRGPRGKQAGDPTLSVARLTAPRSGSDARRRCASRHAVVDVGVAVEQVDPGGEHHPRHDPPRARRGSAAPAAAPPSGPAPWSRRRRRDQETGRVVRVLLIVGAGLELAPPPRGAERASRRARVRAACRRQS